MIRLLSLIFILLSNFLYGQTSGPKTILIPGQGIIIDKDTFSLETTPSYVLSKLDTINYKVDVLYGSGISDGIISFYNAKKELIRSVDTFWMTQSCSIIFNNNLTFIFNGNKGNRLSLDLIKLSYPFPAITTTGEKIGEEKNSIFKQYPTKTGSYNCGDNGFFICYYDKGISFEVKPYKENPDIEMYDRIIGFEIYRSRQE